MPNHSESTRQHIAALDAEILRQQHTTDQLRATWHPCSDVERQLQVLKESVALLK